MTPEQARQAVALAEAGCSVRGIASELQVSRRQVERALAEPAPLESWPAIPVIDLPPLESVPDPEPLPVTVKLDAAELRRLANKAELEADAARDNLRGIAHLRSMGGLPGQRTASAPIVDPQEQALVDEYHARASGRDYSPFQEALRSAKWRGTI